MSFHPSTRVRLASLSLLLTFVLGACLFNAQPNAAEPPLSLVTTTPVTTLPAQNATPAPQLDGIRDVIILSLTEDGYAHFFAYAPPSLSLTRLTEGQYNDASPSLSPDGRMLAFASDRSEYWDLYLLDLTSSEVTRVTDSPEYESAPTWSPDGLWLAYESYESGNLDIVVRPLDNLQAPIRVTTSQAADHSPAWSPGGRQIAFVSTRSGVSQIWIADLDVSGEERFTNIGAAINGRQSHPTWSPDGRYLAFGVSANSDALSGIYVWDSTQPDLPPHWFASGDWAAWSSDGTQLIVHLQMPNQGFVTAFNFPSGALTLPTSPLPGSLHGLLTVSALPSDLAQRYPASQSTPTALWQPSVSPISEGPTSRSNVVELPDMLTNSFSLHDSVDEAFSALRQRVIRETGWDVLASLQYAYVPLSQPLDPGLGDDWLYTGRAFTLNPVIMNASWMVALREEIDQQTYWRIYLRAQAQNGAQGEPLHNLPWDLNARYALDPASYEQGGRLMPELPDGYWVDFTALALEYSWERIPALPNWRTFFSGTRVTEFAYADGLDWHTAMLELYPPEVLVTPTVVVPPTFTPTPTERVWRTPTLTPSPTPRPTFTP